MSPHVLILGGEDHRLRIPFIIECKKRGFQVTAAGTEEAAPFEKANISYHRYAFDRFVNPLADLTAIRAVAKIIRDLQPDIVQTFDTKPNLFGPVAARMAGNKRVVRTINGLGWVYSSKSASALVLRPVFEILHKVTAPWTAVTVFQNRDDQVFFEQRNLIGRGGNELIPGSGIDVAEFEQASRNSASIEELRETFGLGNAPIVLTVTRLSRTKGVPTLLEAAAIMHKRRPDVRFLLVGARETEGKHAVSEAEIEKHAPYVIATGPRSDVAALMAGADIFALPTELREGIPRVLLEAALAAIPIVTTDMPGCVDVVQDSVSGFLVPPRDPNRLADKILCLLDDREKAREMAERARDKIKRDMSLDVVVARYTTAYMELINRSGSFEAQGQHGLSS